ncbi:MAG TPA: imelysin family protein, partial [Mycobacterium sp.]|nr:imelysin family protein [Mycobacterium sp.]
MNRFLAWTTPFAVLGLVLSGCSSEDAGGGEASPTASPTTTTAAAVDSKLVDEAATQYKSYAVEQTKQIVPLTKTFTDAVRANDLAAAQAAYAPSRVPWERIEP